MAFVISTGARSGVQSRFISIMDPMIIISLFCGVGGGGWRWFMVPGQMVVFFFLLLGCSASSLRVGGWCTHLSDARLLSGNYIKENKLANGGVSVSFRLRWCIVRGFWSGRFVTDGHCIVFCWLTWHGAAPSPSVPGSLVLGLQKLVCWSCKH